MNIKKPKEILKAHNDWVKGKGGERANFRDANLRGADLQGANLRDADLQGANLRDADLRDADLQGANLRDADLRDADLRDADLRDADLQGANNLPKIHQSDLAILKQQKGKLRAFKYLNDSISPYQDKEYKVGETYESKNYSDDERILCAEGLNVATLGWCLRDTNGDSGKTYIEIEFEPKNIVAIPYNTDGKFRVKKLTVIRKIPKKELVEYLKPLYPKEEKE